MAGPLSRSTKDVKLGTQAVSKVMYGTYQVWPAMGSADWRMLTKGHPHADWGVYAQSALGPASGGGIVPNIGAINHTFWQLDTDRGGIFPMYQLRNNSDGSRTMQWGGPWEPEIAPGAASIAHTYAPKPPSAGYPVKEVRLMAPKDGGNGIRVELDIDPAKFDARASIQFEGCPLPFSGGTKPLTTSQGRVGTSDTWFYEASSAMPVYVQEDYYFSPAPGMDKCIRVISGYVASYFRYAIGHVVPKGSPTLFNWPNNYFAFGGASKGLQLGDDSLRTRISMAGYNYDSFMSVFGTDPAVLISKPGENALRAKVSGPWHQDWTARGGNDLLHLGYWDSNFTPAIPFTVQDWGTPSGFQASGSSDSVSINGTGSAAGASFEIDDITAAQPKITVVSWGGIKPGDRVSIRFTNDVIFYDSPRTIVLVRN